MALQIPPALAACKTFTRSMGKRQKKLLNANQLQILPKGYHPAKKVVIPHSSHRSISLCPQDYQSRSALMPRLNYQSRIKVPSHFDHKTLATFSRTPKIGTEPAQLPQAVQQAGVMPRPTIPSTGTTVLSLPCPDSWARVPNPPFPLSEYQATLSPGSNHHVEALFIPDHFLKPSDSNHLPMISQGCDHRAEDQTCPDHKFKTTSVPSLNHNNQPTVAPLQRPNQQTSLPQSTRNPSKKANSLERYLNHWQRAIFSPLLSPDCSMIAPSDSDHWVKGTASQTICPGHYLKTKTTLLQPPDHEPWILRSTASLYCNQQVRSTAMPPPCPNHRESSTTFAPFQSPEIPAGNLPEFYGNHVEVSDTIIPSVKHDHQDIPLSNFSGNTEAPMIVPNHWAQVVQNREPPCNPEHLAKASLDLDSWPVVLPPHLNCWATALDHGIFHYVENQTKPSLGPEHIPQVPPCTDPVCTNGFSPLKYWTTPLPNSKQEIKIPPDPNQLVTPTTVPNQQLGTVTDPETWKEVSMNCNHWTQDPLDTFQQVKIPSDSNHWCNAALQLDYRIMVPQNPNRIMVPQNRNCQDQIPPDNKHQDDVSSVPKHLANTIMVLDHWSLPPSDTDQEVELESDLIHWGEAIVGPDHSVTEFLGTDNQTLTLPDIGLQNEDLTDLEHQNGTLMDQDTIPKGPQAACHWVEPISELSLPKLDFETKTQISINHSIMDAPDHDNLATFPIIPEQQNEGTPSSHHQEDAKPLLDLDYESKVVPDQESIDIHLDYRSKIKEVPNSGTLFPLTSENQDDDVLLLPSSDFEAKHSTDLDNVGEISLRTNHQSKTPPDVDHQTEVTLEAPNQVIRPSSLDQDAKIILDSDNCDDIPSFSQQQTMLPPENSKPRKPSSYCDNQEIFSPNQNHSTVQLNIKSQTITPVVPSCQAPQRSCHWTDVPLDTKYRVTHQQTTSHKLVPPSQLKSLDLDHQTEIVPDCKQQVKRLPLMNFWTRTPSDPNPLTEDEKTRELPWCLTYIKPYTIEGGNIPQRIVNGIIKSIPQEKIKNDIYKQILLKCVKDLSYFEDGLCLTSTYTVCLICACWIPYGCPHVQEMKDPYKAELLSISSLLPGSKEEMSVKFVLQVPQLEAGSIFTVRYPDYNISRHLYNKSGKSFHSQSNPSKSRSFVRESNSKLTWFDFIRSKSYQSHGKKLSGSQPSLLGKMHINSSTREERTRGSEKVFKSLFERFQKKRSTD